MSSLRVVVVIGVLSLASAGVAETACSSSWQSRAPGFAAPLVVCKDCSQSLVSYADPHEFLALAVQGTDRALAIGGSAERHECLALARGTLPGTVSDSSASWILLS